MLEHQSQARTSVAYGMVDIPHGWRQGLTTVALLAQGHQPVFSVAVPSQNEGVAKVLISW